MAERYDPQGTLSPITSSSGQHDDPSDNYIEYYVHKSDPDALTPYQESQAEDLRRKVRASGLFTQEQSDYVGPANNSGKSRGIVCANCIFYNKGYGSCNIVSGKIQANAVCDFIIIPGEKGGEDMDKTYDVNTSETTDNSYQINDTTEPDSRGDIAVQKSDADVRTGHVEGKNAFSTTANTTVDAPSPGNTTEPTTADHKVVPSTVAGETVNKDDTFDPSIGLDDSSVVQLDNSCSCCDNCDDDCDGDCCPACIDAWMGWSDDDDVAANQPELSSMVQAIDASLDTVGHLVNGQDLSVLPFWASQALTAALSAGQVVDDLMSNYGIYNPDMDKVIAKRDFTTARRKQLAREGKAMPDGSFPIENTQDLKNAVRSWGRGGASPAVKRHIMNRARSLNAMGMVPDKWKNSIQKSAWGEAFLPSVW